MRQWQGGFPAISAPERELARLRYERELVRGVERLGALSGEAKLAWRHLVEELAARPGEQLVVSPVMIGSAQGTSDAAGRRSLKGLERAGVLAIDRTHSQPGRWLVTITAGEQLVRLGLVDEAQLELFDRFDEPEGASVVAGTVGMIEVDPSGVTPEARDLGACDPSQKAPGGLHSPGGDFSPADLALAEEIEAARAAGGCSPGRSTASAAGGYGGASAADPAAHPPIPDLRQRNSFFQTLDLRQEHTSKVCKDPEGFKSKSRRGGFDDGSAGATAGVQTLGTSLSDALSRKMREPELRDGRKLVARQEALGSLVAKVRHECPELVDSYALALAQAWLDGHWYDGRRQHGLSEADVTGLFRSLRNRRQPGHPKGPLASPGGYFAAAILQKFRERSIRDRLPERGER